MAGIFISYRRDDAAADAGRLHDDLQRRCIEGSVFSDMSVRAGTDFRQELFDQLDMCDVLLALIGPRWLRVRNPSTGQRRLDEEVDYVRLEISTALAKHKVVIPVLLPGATMPAPEDLPESIRDLAWRNAFAFRYDRWIPDTDELVKQLPDDLQCKQGTTAARPSKQWAAIVMLPVVLLASLHLFAVYNLQSDPHYLAAGASFAIGLATAVQFRFAYAERLLVALTISLLTGVVTSILVAVVSGQNIIPTELAEIRLFVTFVASILIGYLVGIHAMVLLPRQKKKAP